MDHAQEILSHEAFAAWLAAVPPAAAEVRVREQPGVAVHLVAGLDHLMCNRATLLPRADADLDAAAAWAMDQFASAGLSRYFVQHAAVADDGRLTAILRSRGLEPYRRNWAQLSRPAGPADPVEMRGLTLERARPAHGPALGALLRSAFGLPEASAPLLAALGAARGWEVFVALDGSLPVAVGGLFVSGTLGYLGFAATSPTHRGRGAQQALIAARIEAARAKGCTQLWSETGEPVAGERNTSWINLERAGFVPTQVLCNFTLPGVTW